MDSSHFLLSRLSCEGSIISADGVKNIVTSVVFVIIEDGFPLIHFPRRCTLVKLDSLLSIVVVFRNRCVPNPFPFTGLNSTLPSEFIPAGCDDETFSWTSAKYACLLPPPLYPLTDMSLYALATLFSSVLVGCFFLLFPRTLLILGDLENISLWSELSKRLSNPT